MNYITDEELKWKIIKKYFIQSDSIRDIWKKEIMFCMEEWAGVISKRIDEEDELDMQDKTFID